MKIIIGLVGEIATGKTTVTDYLKSKHNAVSFRFSDMLRDILDRLYIEKSRINMQKISTAVRQNYGDDTMSRVIAEDVKNSNENFIIIEGIRRPSDVTYLKKLPEFKFIAINTDEKTRWERLTQRSENPDDQAKTWEQFQKDGLQEAEGKVKEISDQADYIIDNNGAFEELYRQVDEIIKKCNSDLQV
ncbi:AAA family ATPase [Patescibacteria group bacterium]|nr:AAA family ATPase [Patescibacteria group bacterium]